MTTPMKPDVFAERLDALGPDLSRWPQADAEAASALTAASPEARRLLADARVLARLVEEAAQAPTPNGFAFRVMGEVSSRRSDRLFWLTGSPGRLGLAGMSFCAATIAIGVMLGAVTGSVEAGAGELDIGAPLALSFVEGSL